MSVASHGPGEADHTPETPPDPDAATTPEPVPARDEDTTRPARPAAGAGRRLRLEVLLAGLGSLALAVLMTWPAARHPTSTIPQDIYDPLLETWSAAWGGHALLHPATHLWN